jgi:hypothetical protein
MAAPQRDRTTDEGPALIEAPERRPDVESSASAPPGVGDLRVEDLKVEELTVDGAGPWLPSGVMAA